MKIGQITLFENQIQLPVHVDKPKLSIMCIHQSRIQHSKYKNFIPILIHQN